MMKRAVIITFTYVLLTCASCDASNCHGHDHGELYIPESGCHNYFYQCVHGTGFRMSCADGSAFNRIQKKCDWKRSIPECLKSTAFITPETPQSTAVPRSETTGAKRSIPPATTISTTKLTIIKTTTTTTTTPSTTKSNTENEICGKSLPKFHRSRVVGGNAASDGAWPWQALFIRNPHRLVSQIRAMNILGGGSVINSKWILTAGHIFDGPFARARTTNDWRGFLVILGMTKYPAGAESLPNGTIVFEPRLVIRHESYNEVTYDYDVALLKFGNAFYEKTRRLVPFPDISEIPFEGNVRPVCLPCLNGCGMKTGVTGGRICDQLGNRKSNDEQLDTRDLIATVTGFGSTIARNATIANFKYPEILQQASVRVLDNESCRQGVEIINQVYANFGQKSIARYTKQMLCARGPDMMNITDTCQGDSGGPLVLKITTSGGETCWTQIGIVSWGLGCASTVDDAGQLPGYYTNVAASMKWITETAELAQTSGNNIKTSIICPEPKQIKHGRVKEFENQRKLGSFVKYFCDEGYVISGNNIIICKDGGKWEPEPTCRENRCPTPIRPTNGRIIGNSFLPNSIITYKCNAGYVLRGDQVSTCKASGRWSGKPRSCKIESCPPPEALENGKIFGSNFSKGSELTFKCNIGYILQGNNISRCNANGAWSGKPRICKAIVTGCPKPDTLANGIVVGDKFDFGSVITFACNPGYIISGLPFSVCSELAIWGPAPFPTCTEKMLCETPEAPKNGRIVSSQDSYKTGSYIIYSCNKGFRMIGLLWSRCLKTNTFSSPPPKCVQSS